MNTGYYASRSQGLLGLGMLAATAVIEALQTRRAAPTVQMHLIHLTPRVNGIKAVGGKYSFDTLGDALAKCRAIGYPIRFFHANAYLQVFPSGSYKILVVNLI